MLIAISETCSVSADWIAEVRIDEDFSCILIKMKDGTVHKYQPKYPDRRMYVVFEQVVITINSALRNV